MCIKLKHIAKKSSTSKLFCNSTNIFTFYVLPVSDSVLAISFRGLLIQKNTNMALILQQNYANKIKGSCL